MTNLLIGAEKKAQWGSVLPPGLPYSSYSQQFENGRAVFAGQGRLYGFSGYNSNASAQFILLFDSDANPADEAIPVFTMTAAGSSNFYAYWGSSGRWFTRGCWIANSAEADDLSAGAADCWFDCQFVPVFADAAGAITA